MVPRSPPAGRRVNLWQVSLPLHLRSVSVTPPTVPTGRRGDTLQRAAVTGLLMNTEERQDIQTPTKWLGRLLLAAQIILRPDVGSNEAEHGCWAGAGRRGGVLWGGGGCWGGWGVQRNATQRGR